MLSPLSSPRTASLAMRVTFIWLLIAGCTTLRAGDGIDSSRKKGGPSPWEWAVSGSGKDIAAGYALTLDREGDLYVAVCVDDTATIGGNLIPCAPHGDFATAILRYRDGRPEHPQLLAVTVALPGTRGSAAPMGIHVDRDGNIFVIGELRFAVDFGGAVASVKERGAFVVKYDNTGELQWVKTVTVGKYDYVRWFTVSDKGDLYLGLHSDGPVTIGDSTIQQAGKHALLVKFDPDGAVRWVERLGGESRSRFIDVTIGPDGNPVVCWGLETKPGGRTRDDYPISPIYQIMLESYTPKGMRRWSHSIGVANDVTHSYLQSDRNGILFDGDYTLDSSAVRRFIDKRSGNTLARFDARGNGLWAVSIGPEYNYFRGTGVDDEGNFYYVSNYSGKPRIWGGGIPDSVVTTLGASQSSRRDIIVVCRDAASGEFRWATTTGGTGDEPVLGAVVSPAGEVYVTGWFYGEARFGEFSFDTKARNGYYLAKLKGRARRKL